MSDSVEEAVAKAKAAHPEDDGMVHAVYSQGKGGKDLCTLMVSGFYGDDGIVRPVMRGEILASDGTWHRTEFLVDTGADRTLISASA